MEHFLVTRLNLDRYGVSKYVTLIQKGFTDWLKNPEDFDFMHVDISNNGEIIEKLYANVKDKVNNGSVVVFEGGSEKRDNFKWMARYNFRKIQDTNVPFEIIDDHFPSLSMIKRS